MSSCDAKIRPFPGPTELTCEVELEGAHTHSSTLRDYAYPGSASEIHWMEDDRRNFHGDWPGRCVTVVGSGATAAPSCVLPAGHRGNHAP